LLVGEFYEDVPAKASYAVQPTPLQGVDVGNAKHDVWRDPCKWNKQNE
jgi:hypothetical protein